MEENRRPGGRLPRTRSSFADEFFQTDPFRNFNYHGAPHGFGNEGYGSNSNSRMFGDDGGGSFFDTFNRPSFNDEPAATAFFPSNLASRTFKGPEENGAETQRQTPPKTAAPNNNNHYQHQQPRGPSHSVPFHHQRSKSHYDNMDDNDGWWNHQRHPFYTMEDNGFRAFPQGHHHQQQQHPNDPNVHVIKIQHEDKPSRHNNRANKADQFVEINNAAPNYETLNPDKRRRFSTNHNDHHYGRTSSIPNITIDDFSEEPSNVEEPKQQTAIPLPAPAIPLPAPEGMKAPADSSSSERDDEAEKNVVVVGENEKENQKDKYEERTMEEEGDDFVALTESSESLINLLDDAECQVEQLRETASRLEQEKEAILERIKSIKMTGKRLDSLAEGEKDELLLNVDRILSRCNTVTVRVETPRDANQTRALETVNKMINSVLEQSEGDAIGSQMKIRGFLNACHPDEVGHIDEKFQSAIIECTADDQKKIRQKLDKLVKVNGK